MKIAITGHTQGIGKRAYDRLCPDIIGFSRSNGYDITNSGDQKRIIEESKDCDIFINNAMKAHYETLKQEGYTVENLRDIGRIAAVMNSVAKVLNS